MTSRFTYHALNRATNDETTFRALVDAGVEEGTLYYNLADAYFKAGDLGRAILN